MDVVNVPTTRLEEWNVVVVKVGVAPNAGQIEEAILLQSCPGRGARYDA